MLSLVLVLVIKKLHAIIALYPCYLAQAPNPFVMVITLTLKLIDKYK
jgi:hypothetical protein